MFGMRRFDLDGAELFFERGTGLSIRHQGPSTAFRSLRAPRLVQFGITNACNLACGFCSRDVEAESSWTAADAFRILADLAKAGTLEVAFGGGEPLAFRGFDALVARLHTETPLAVGITTNGVLLTEARLRNLAPHVSQIRVSIYEDNEWRRTLALLAREAVPFGANLLVTPNVLRNLDERVREMVALGTRDILLLGYVGDDPTLALAAADEAALAREVIVLAEKLRGRADLKLGVCWGDRLTGVPRLATSGTALQDCGAGRDFVVIASDRSLAACSFHDVRLPITSAADVLEAWERHQVALGLASSRPGCARGPALVQLRHRRRPAAAPSPASAVDTFHVYAAWSSNNSGSYTLVGSFSDSDAARTTGERLETLFREMSAFYTDRDEQVRRLLAAGETRIVLPEVESPAHRFFATEGLAAPPGDFVDESSWPSDGGSAEKNVLITGQQVIVHVGWTVTMPRALAELFFKAGARVDTEIDHAHHRLVVVARLYPQTYGQTAEERETNRAALATVRAEVDALLGNQAAARFPGDEPTPHAWSDEGDVLELGLVPRWPVPELAAIRDIAERRGKRMRVRFFEALSGGGDPLADMRSRTDGRAAGAWSVVLWREGTERIAVMKVIREHASLGLRETKQRLGDLPVTLIAGIAESLATAFAKALRDVGADADAERARSS
jgi:ribosomal protein L7/L12